MRSNNFRNGYLLTNNFHHKVSSEGEKLKNIFLLHYYNCFAKGNIN